MAHLHDVLDDDPHFKIDADSREIIRASEKELLLIQDDHNSERCTFDIPKFIDGHDMASCNVIRVHFINVNAENPTETSVGLYEVDDLRVSTDDPSTMVFSWLISNEGTALIGTLSFLVEFICKNDQDVIEYSWHTGIYTGGIVSKGMNNSEIVIGQHYDVLNRWVALIDQEGDRVRTDVLTRINDAVNQVEKNSVSAINSHAENVKKDLVIYGLDVGDVLVQETGNSEEKIMSQASVTEAINETSSNLETSLIEVRSDISEFKTEVNKAMSDLGSYKEVELSESYYNDIEGADIEMLKDYVIEHDSESVWSFRLTCEASYHSGDPSNSQIVKRSAIGTIPFDEYNTGYSIMRVLKYELDNPQKEGYTVTLKVLVELDGTRYDNWTFDITDAYDGAEIYLNGVVFGIIGCTRLFECKPHPVSQNGAFHVEANGIESITKTGTSVTSTGVVNTYTILLDDGTTATFDVKDGVGISSFSRYSQGDYEDTYKVEFTNGTSKTFTVPNNNTVGIRRSDSGPMIHAEDLIPLSHRVDVQVRSKNMIPYPWGDGASIETSGKVEKDGVTYTIDDDKTIILNGTTNCNTSFQMVYQTQGKLSVTKGKTYTFSSVSGLSGSRGYMFLQIYVGGESKKTYTIRNNDVATFTSEYDGYVSIGIVLLSGVTFDNDRVQIQLEEGDTVTPYTPYVDLATVKLTRCCKNLIAHPYYDKKNEYNGITITDNAGVLTFNGTATADSSYTLFRNSTIPVDGKYTLSGVTGGSATTFYMQPYVDGVAQKTVIDGPVTYEWHGSITQISIFFKAGVSFDNLTISPQLEVGDTASEFEEYHGTNYSLYSIGVPTTPVTPYVPRIYHTMNLLTDTEGVIIDATYNVDQTAAFNNIELPEGTSGYSKEEIDAKFEEQQELINSIGGGSSKLYHHHIKFSNNIEYDENGFPSTYDNVSGHIDVYRTNDAPITSMAELSPGEITCAHVEYMSDNEAGDQYIPSKVWVHSNNTKVQFNAMLLITGQYAENWGAAINIKYSDFILEDTVTEV